MSELEQELKKRLAEKLGVSPAEVSCDEIHKWRQKNLYPNIRYQIDSVYGGYISHKKRILSNDEIEDIKNRADLLIDKFLQEEQKEK